MKKHGYKINRNVVYREVQDEVVLIHLDDGKFYYFSKSAKPFFNFLQEPKTIDQIFSCLNEKVPREDLEDFCKELHDKRILLVESAENPSVLTPDTTFEKPLLLREGQKKLDQIASDVVLLTSTTL